MMVDVGFIRSSLRWRSASPGNADRGNRHDKPREPGLPLASKARASLGSVNRKPFARFQVGREGMTASRGTSLGGHDPTAPEGGRRHPQAERYNGEHQITTIPARAGISARSRPLVASYSSGNDLAMKLAQCQYAPTPNKRDSPMRGVPKRIAESAGTHG